MTYQTPNLAWAAGDPVLFPDMNRIEGNTEALHNPPAASSGFLDVSDYTINSTTYANVDGTNLSLSITLAGDTAVVFLNFTVTSLRKVYFDISVDGTRVGGDDGLFTIIQDNVAGQRFAVGMAIPIEGLSAGSHTFNLMWKNDAGGTSTLYGGNGSAGDQVHPKMRVVEIS
jgi:hypothetical protein